MKLLLVAQKQISSSKTSCALGTFEGFLFGVGAFVTFQVLQASKGALASSTNMGTRLVGLGGRERRGCLRGVHGDRRSLKGNSWSVF